MKASCVAIVLASFALLGQFAQADVRNLHPTQHIAPPDGYTSFGDDVGIDGRHMIVLGTYSGGQAALLYRRDTTTSPFTFQRVLQSISGASVVTSEVAMKNGIAVVRFGNQEWIFEFNGTTYVPGISTQPIGHPGGVAISGARILIGGNDCEYDAVIYEKSAAGTWEVTGNINDHQGTCRTAGFAVELNYDYALLRVPSTNQASAWRRNGSAFGWVPAGTLNLASDIPVSDQPYALQNSTAVAPGNYVFRRSGSSWDPARRAPAANYGNTLGVGGFNVVYRDGLLLATESVESAAPYVYLETGPGYFEHVAVLETTDDTVHVDVSKKIVVAAIRDAATSSFGVEVFDLNDPLPAPAPIVNDFETLNTSGFTFHFGQWGLSKRGINDVLTQKDLGSSDTYAFLNTGDWTGYQRIEADITPHYNGFTAWVGVMVRFINFENFFYARITSTNTIGIFRRQNGVDSLQRQAAFTPASLLHVSFADDGKQLLLTVNNQSISVQAFGPLNHGRAGLLTSASVADFDNVHVAATEVFPLLEKDYRQGGTVNGQEFTEKGGTWQVVPDAGSQNSGLAQSNTTGTALATIGTPVENQEIVSSARLDSFNSANTGAWFGFVGRYQDSLNYYSVAVRSNGQVQIRRTMNGAVTVLGSAAFTAQPGQYHAFRFRLVHDQLQLFVDGVLVAWARDPSFVQGQYGLATHYAAAKWQSVRVQQP